jgi:hypothetical protein
MNSEKITIKSISKSALYFTEELVSSYIIKCTVVQRWQHTPNRIARIFETLFLIYIPLWPL